MQVDGFLSPEHVALAGWSSAAQARVVSSTVLEDRAEVVLEVGPAYRYWVYYVKRDDGWIEAGSANGPSEGWEEPHAFDWLDWLS